MNPISGITFGLYHALCITPPPSIKLGLQNVLTMIWCEYDVIHLHTDTQTHKQIRMYQVHVPEQNRSESNIIIFLMMFSVFSANLD